MTIKLKIAGVPKDYAKLPFGRQLEFRHLIQAFKNSAKSVWLSQKRQTSAKAIKEAVELYNVKEYYCQFNDENGVRDDVFEFWYTTLAPETP